MSNVPIGARREEKLLVTSDVAISFLGLENGRVLSTPQMILHMEKTSRNLLLPLLDPGHDSLGTRVNIAHLAAAPMGSTVIFRSEILEQNERRVTFKVEASRDGETIGEGTHERAIIHVERFAARMAAKKAASETRG
jgi:fluoroacetyl-CoA thioesterase